MLIMPSIDMDPGVRKMAVVNGFRTPSPLRHEPGNHKSA